LAGIRINPTNNVIARSNLVNFLTKGCPNISEIGEDVISGEDLARLILGNDFLSAEDVAKGYGWNYTDEQKKNLANTIPGSDKGTLPFYSSRIRGRYPFTLRAAVAPVA